MKKISILFLSFLGTVLALASSPSGTPPKTPQEAFNKADAVFVGYVKSTRKDELGYDSIATVDVLKIWKGSGKIPPRVTVDGSGNPTYPARIFKWGEYLFYVNGPGVSGGSVRFRADSYLHRVIPGEGTADDKKFLKGKPANEILYDLQRSPWQVCSASLECVAVQSVCSGWQAVNKTFEREASDYFHEQDISSDCTGNNQSPRPQVACVDGFCTTKP